VVNLDIVPSVVMKVAHPTYGTMGISAFVHTVVLICEVQNERNLYTKIKKTNKH